MLLKQQFILSTSDKGVNKHLVPNAILEGVWTRPRDRLSSLDSSTSLLVLEVTSEYAAHFYDVFRRSYQEASDGCSDLDLAPQPSFSLS